MKKNREVINGTIDSVGNLYNASIFTRLNLEHYALNIDTIDRL
ncbi:MAG: hypothetical protein ACP5DZ_08950 [Bacteroidales bacterium]